MEEVLSQPAADPGSTPGRSRRALWRRLLAPIGLQGRILLAISFLMLIGLSVSSWVFVHSSRDTLSDILGEQARQISQTLALAAEVPYETNDVGELHRLGRDLLRSRNIVLVVFYDASGKPLTAACRDPDFTLQLWKSVPQLQVGPQSLMQVRAQQTLSLGSYLQVTAPVFDILRGRGEDGRGNAGMHLLGYLTVGVSQNSEQASLKRTSYLGIAMGGLIFLLSLPLARGMVHRIFLPIRNLVEASHRIAAGDYSAHVATERPDEIGMLARSFNEMACQIRRHEEELRVANDNLEQANRDLEEKVRQRTSELQASNQRLSAEIAEKEDFLRAVSHDLNAPLRNISGMATMLLMKYRGKFEEDIVHRLERICKNVEVETSLITELLELSRIKTRRQKMDMVDLRALIEELGGMFEQDLSNQGIELMVEGALPALYCERARLRQVFQNLIDNAIKYMGEGAVRRICVGCGVGEEGFEFYVRDTGIGIDAEDISKVFYVFRRGKNTAEMKVAGKGVGLASVKSIIETYGGRIWVESRVGEGSTFRFVIPRSFASVPVDGEVRSAA